MSSLGLMDNEWQEREQNLLRQLEDERFRCCPLPPLITFSPTPYSTAFAFAFAFTARVELFPR